MCTCLSERLGLLQQAAEDDAEVAQQPLAVLEMLQDLGICEVGGAVEQRSTWTHTHTTFNCLERVPPLIAMHRARETYSRVRVRVTYRRVKRPTVGVKRPTGG